MEQHKVWVNKFNDGNAIPTKQNTAKPCDFLLGMLYVGVKEIDGRAYLNVQHMPLHTASQYFRGYCYSFLKYHKMNMLIIATCKLTNT